MGRVLIDTSVLIEEERGRLELAPKVADLEAFVASITVSEILHGLHRAKTGEQRSRRQAYIEYLLVNYPVLPFDLAAARIHARIGAELAAAGVPIGSHDLILAATAMAAGAQIATRDARSFGRVPGLILLRW